jgi:integrase
MKEARLRRDFIAGELAAGRNPRTSLVRLRTAAARPRGTVKSLAERYVETRVDMRPAGRETLRSQLRRFADEFGSRRPDEITVDDVRDWIASLKVKGATVKKYVQAARQLLDFAGADPNPARDPALKLPRIEREEVSPPSAEHYLAILDRVPARQRLPIVTLEQTAMRIGELASLRWADVDVAGCRFRLRSRETKTAAARWAQVPPWLMQAIADTCPTEDRVPARAVFLVANPRTIRTAMERACRTAGIPLYSPHDLRHRRLSLWHGQGVPVRELAERAGHARPTLTLDVYSHVMPIEEVTPETLLSHVVVRSR